MIFFFFTGSVCGYVWEVLIFLVKEGTFRNRGFLYGPWLPVYGIGAVLFSVILSPRELLPDSSGKYKKNNPVTVFFLSALLGPGLELVMDGFLISSGIYVTGITADIFLISMGISVWFLR